MGTEEITVLPPTLDALVVALCSDYSRRRGAIEKGSVAHRVDTEYWYYNYKIYDATVQIVGVASCEQFIKEIGARTGYAYSKVEGMSEVLYKQQKQRAKVKIAQLLHLI